MIERFNWLLEEIGMWILRILSVIVFAAFGIVALAGLFTIGTQLGGWK